MLKNIKVGDTVFVVYQKSRHSQPKEPTLEKVVRVGKKYGYIERHGREAPFYLDSGISYHKESNERVNGYGFDVYASEEDYRKEKHEADEFNRLQSRLISDSWRRLVDLPPDAVQKIHAILDALQERA